VQSEGGGDIERGVDALWAEDSDVWGVPGASVHWVFVGRDGGAELAVDAWEDVADFARQQGSVCGVVESIWGDAVSQSGDQAGDGAGGFWGNGVDGGGGDHGSSAQDVAAGGGAVSSGEFFDGAGGAIAGEFFEEVRGAQSPF